MSSHYGLNLGYIEAEAVTYASTTWIDIGMRQNMMPSQQKMQNSVQMLFKAFFVARFTAYLRKLERGDL